MTNETSLTSIHEFHDELATLVMSCDAHKADLAADLVAVAVALAAADGCDPEMQRVNIERFAANAIAKLLQFSASAGIVH